MEEIRCPYCKKLLFKAKGTYKIEIKCNKCKNIYIVNKMYYNIHGGDING